MDRLLSLIFANPLQAVGIISLGLCSLLGTALYLMLRRDFRGFERKLEVWESNVGKLFDETRSSLRTHSEDMGKATKAIAGDMLRVKESVFNLKEDLVGRIEEIKTFAADVDRESVRTAEKLSSIVESFDERFGRVLDLREDIEAARGRILVLDERTGKLRAHCDERFEKIAQALLHLTLKDQARRGSGGK